MERTRIFISSTYFDLAQVRDDLSRLIAEIGHFPVVSESPSFPVIPDLNTIENCKRNVANNADLFVLIVGGRRGSTDPATNRAVVAVEYEAALSAGLDAFVFVFEPVLTLLPVWEKNPTADFSPQVESPEVFQFVKNIRQSQRWTFPFEKASDIGDVLRAQLSIYLRYLIARKRGQRLDPLPEFATESDQAKNLAMDRPQYWEYLLTANLLKGRFSKIRRKHEAAIRGLVLGQHQNVSSEEFIRWVGAKLDEFQTAIEVIKVAVTDEIPLAWGPPGESGDPVRILQAVMNVEAGCTALIDWEADAVRMHPPSTLDTLRNAMIGSTAEIVEELSPIPDRLEEAIRLARAHAGPGPLEYNINLVFRFSRADKIVNAMRSLRERGATM